MDLNDKQHIDEIGMWFESTVRSHSEICLRMISCDKLCASFLVALAIIVDSLSRGRRLFIMGNGGSAADAQHLAAELVGSFMDRKRPPFNVEALTADIASITAISNDFGFQYIFERQLVARGREGDVAIGLSTSGTSSNVIQALKTASQVKKMGTILFTGQHVNFKKPEGVDVCIQVPSMVTARIQEGYMLLGHMMCEYIEKHLSRC